MLEESVVYEPRLGYPFYITAKRYWLPEFVATVHNPEALTLICLHSTSFHKETLEPTIEHIFQLALQPNNSVPIREAWSIEAPNHGLSAQLNEDIFCRPEFSRNFTCEKFAHTVHHFLSAGPDHGARVEFRDRNLVGIGHSLGGVSIPMLLHIKPFIRFSTIIIIEPMISPGGKEPLHELGLQLVRGAYERRDCWPTREMAKEALKYRHGATKWRPEILDLFVKYGIRAHPGSYHTEFPYNGVALAMSREEEAAMYRDVDALTKPLDGLRRTCEEIPVHIVFGAKNDFVPRSIQDSITDPSAGLKFASVTRVESGHLVPQQAPDKLAVAVMHILSSTEKRTFPNVLRSKL